MAKLTSWVKNHKKAIVGGTVGALVLGGTVVSLWSGRKKSDSSKSSSSDTTGSTSSGSGTGSSSSGSSKSSSSSSSKSTPTPVKQQQALIEKPTEIYSAPQQYSVQRVGLEVYRTDEEKYSQYISPYNEKSIDIPEVNITGNTESEYTMSIFKLHRGRILDIYYYGDLISIELEQDYVDMSESATINRGEINLQQFYKGVRLCLLTEWEAPNTTLEWTDLKVAIDGFITEQTFKEKNVDVKVEGFTKLFEQLIPFKFTQMYRSEILREIILTAGLQPFINAEGLDDDITDFTNEVKASSSSSNKPIGESSGNIAELAQEVCKGKSTDHEKAQAIHTYIRNHVDYPANNYSNHHRCPMEVLRTGISNCCDRARLGHEMANAVGLHNRGVHGPNHVWVQYKINGKWVDSDPGVSRPKLGAVYLGMSMDRVWEFPSCK